ncbi:MAG: dihydroorotate dehydrogenase electron transfer subunit [Caldilineaceae bacterium]|nr:dihydroorotate dehydrogenase electron transfer subunit [Caldilineaceae bacterium]
MDRLTLPTATRIAAIEIDNYRTKTFVLDARLDALPGQFVMAWLPRFDEKPFSLVSADPVTLMITAVGPFTTLVHQLAVGDRLWIRGPFGRGFDVASDQQRQALVGGGYGVAPLYWLAQQQAAKAAAIHVVIGARTKRDVLYAERFARQVPPVTLHITTEDGTAGTRGVVTDALEPLLASRQIDGVYACGPHGMLAALERLGTEHGVPCQLSWEAYMRCAIGICGACEHEGHVLCMDGPVLRTLQGMVAPA